MSAHSPNLSSVAEAGAQPAEKVPFGANELRLNGRQWVVSLGIALLVIIGIPRVWPRIERFQTGPDYRIPYELSNDYWLYGQRLRRVADARKILVLGDSVVWGEYVLPDGTLSHFLSREWGEMDHFVNVGVNGIFPLAMEGLIRHYGGALRGQKVLLQCNVLWLTSPKADLSEPKEVPFNHATLVPQFCPWIPCYRAGAEERLSAVIGRQSDALAWVGHIQNCYFGQKSIPQWTLEEEGDTPVHALNAYRNPLAQITLAVLEALADDPQRGPRSARHKPWSESGRGNTRFDWVPLESSLQWQALQRVVGLLRERGNDVFVVLGPFNEHMLAEENRPVYRTLRDGIAGWLRQNQVACLVPETLPGELYADASHPLTDGYALLAKQLLGESSFRRWCDGRLAALAHAR